MPAPCSLVGTQGSVGRLADAQALRRHLGMVGGMVLAPVTYASLQCLLGAAKATALRAHASKPSPTAATDARPSQTSLDTQRFFRGNFGFGTVQEHAHAGISFTGCHTRFCCRACPCTGTIWWRQRVALLRPGGCGYVFFWDSFLAHDRREGLDMRAFSGIEVSWRLHTS